MEAVQRLDLGPSVAGALKQAIFRGELAPGSRLVEAELADRFGTSRGPVRDALVELEQSGLVESRPRRGSVVRALTVDDVAEIYSLRLVLESLAVRTLAARTDFDPTPGLQAALARLDGAHTSGNRVEIGEADMAFHRTIVQFAGHQRLLTAWERLADQTMLLMTELSSVAPVIQGPAGDHQAIAEALQRHDGEAAVAALERHLASASDTMAATRA